MFKRRSLLIYNLAKIKNISRKKMYTLAYNLLKFFISQKGISSKITGDHPEDVKARLKFWAQAVACTVRLCN